MLEVAAVHYAYEGSAPGQEALRGVDLAVAPGEFVALLGANGSGKSTLAKLMAALLQPTTGEVTIDGISTWDQQRMPELRRLVGMVFQNPDNQIIGSTVQDDLAFGPENQGRLRAETRDQVAAALSLLGLEEAAAEQPHQLSGGQKQRVAIAAAVAMKPRYLILDEPTALLDPAGRTEVRRAIRRLHRQEGMALILITHFMEEAAMADRVVVLNRGQVAMMGSPRTLFAQQDQVRALGLEPPLAAQVAAGLRARGVEVPANVLDLEELKQYLWPSG